MKNIQIFYFSNLKGVIDDWTLLYDRSSLSYFCSPQWHKVVLAFLTNTFITNIIYKLTYFVVKDQNETVLLIGFFFIRNKWNKKYLNFTHLVGPSDYYDLIYSDDFDGALIPNVIEQILNDYKASGFCISNIKSDSKFLLAVSAMERIKFDKLNCVSIELPDSYDSYVSLLSKNARQNLRTAQNRLMKNNLNLKFTLFGNKDLHEINFPELKALYKQRNKGKYQKSNWKSKLYSNIDNLFRDGVDMFDLKELRETDFTLGKLEIDNELAAYFFGFTIVNRIEINRVVINDKFAFYSPGILLLNEFIKSMIGKNLRIVDLTVGDEKYKYDLGGNTHEIFNISGDL